MGSAFRYLAVMELQKDGTPHFHVLLHELRPSSVRWKDVHREWSRNGFHKTNLLKGHSELKAVAYACKYMLKDTGLGRIRASLGYGDARDMDRRLDALRAKEGGALVTTFRENDGDPSIDTLSGSIGRQSTDLFSSQPARRLSAMFSWSSQGPPDRFPGNGELLPT